MINKLLGALKAHSSGLVSAAMVYLAVTADGTFDSSDKQLVVGALLAAWGITYAVPNKK